MFSKVIGKAIVTVALALVALAIGTVGYGYMGKRLSPVRTVDWLLGRIQLSDSLRPAAAQGWINGDAVFYSDKGPLPHRRDGFLYQVTDRKRTSTFRDRLKPNTKIKFDITPEVPSLYMLYRGDGAGMVLFPDGQSPAGQSNRSVSIPRSDLILLEGGPATEHFVLIASRKQLPGIDALRAKNKLAPGDVDTVVASLENDPEAYVLHVYIPHQ